MELLETEATGATKKSRAPGGGTGGWESETIFRPVGLSGAVLGWNSVALLP